MSQSSPAVGYLKIAASVVVVLIAIVVAINLASFRLMLRPQNASVVELVDGWSRLYKPILYDTEQPQVAIFGRSFVRDAFDPEDITRLIGKTTFNFAVSGASPYENRRFAQSAAANPDLEAIILNIDSFDAPVGSPKTYYGFDESVLNVHSDGSANRFVWWNRAIAVTLTGAAVGNNIQLLGILARLNAGAGKADVVASYQRRNDAAASAAARLAAARAAIFPEVAGPGMAPLVLPDPQKSSGLPELDTAIDTYCGRPINVYLYLTPNSYGMCNQPVALRLRVLAYLRQRQQVCRAHFHMFDFQYPNAVTLEGVATPVIHALYYRPDAHPRPTTGLLMAPVMFGVQFPPGTPDAVKADFGTDLLASPDPLAWWQRRLDRCTGHWDGGDRDAFLGGATAD